MIVAVLSIVESEPKVAGASAPALVSVGASVKIPPGRPVGSAYPLSASTAPAVASKALRRAASAICRSEYPRSMATKMPVIAQSPRPRLRRRPNRRPSQQ